MSEYEEIRLKNIEDNKAVVSSMLLFLFLLCKQFLPVDWSYDAVAVILCLLFQCFDVVGQKQLKGTNLKILLQILCLGYDFDFLGVTECELMQLEKMCCLEKIEHCSFVSQECICLTVGEVNARCERICRHTISKTS